MAETNSIASRMEKLAKLKRMKQSLSAHPAPSEPAAETAPAPTMEPAATPDISSVVQEELTNTHTPDTPDDNALPAADMQSEAVDPSAESTTDAAEATGQADSDWFDDHSTDDAIAPEALTADEDPGDEIPADLWDTADEDEVAPVDSADTAASNETDDLLREAGLDPDKSAMEAIDDLAAIVGITDEEEAPAPDFTTQEIDPDLLDREFTADASAEDVPVAAEDEAGRIAVTFDESRTTLLNHVSRQMNCSVEDVVVTALDWYLDALFGEDGEEAKAG